MSKGKYDKVDPCLLSSPKEGLRVTMPVGVNCPLKCKHCYQEGVARYSVDLGTNLNALAKMGESGVSKLYWDGAEPMTNRDIGLYLAVINHMKSKPGASPYLFERVSIATNGIFVNRERAEKLYAGGLRNIMVSLDGATPATHDYFRGLGSYEKAVRAIKILKDVKFDVRIGTTVWKEITKELEDIVKLGLEFGVNEIAFNWMQPIGEALNHQGLLVPNEHFQAVSEKVKAISARHGTRIKISFHRGGETNPDAACKGGVNIAYVSGEWVWPCSWISVVAPEFKSELSLKEHTLKEIIENDPTIQQFRETVDALGEDGACCPALCKVYNGAFKGPDPISAKGVHLANQKELI